MDKINSIQIASLKAFGRKIAQVRKHTPMAAIKAMVVKEATYLVNNFGFESDEAIELVQQFVA